ncbi:dTMP kinase [Tannockella kyphosi]|uniref:dTMP kinase n=1 Tax=Tannockella kyphosi TaxID=2899121 RepID=UPI0020135C55|nr:dTMP kinase [Tannockella kyphosi]
MQGIFITLEGPDGSGKTTVIQLLEERLKNQGRNVVVTREPGGIDIAEQIRRVILDPKNTAMEPRTEALLYAASRRQHLIEKVKPAIEQGAIVLCDRFVDSSLVYQGVGRKIGIEEVYDMNMFAIEGIFPTKTIFFDIPYEVGLQRIDKSDRIVDRLDMESNDFHHLVYQGYMTICDKYSDRIEKIDASKSIEEVCQQAMDIIEKYL